MEFRILGPLEVTEEGRSVPLGGHKQRALLALLLLHRGEVVSADRLIDELWNERPPATAAKSVHVYVSKLRRALGNEVLVTRAPGYLLRVEEGTLDLDRFEALVQEAKEAAPEARAAALRQALALWRGSPLADFAYEPFAQSEIGRLEELRVRALEARIDAELALGLHADLVGELEAHVAEHPLRERLRGQLMLALYRSGRQGEALAAHQDARRALIDELGIEPSRALQELERSILRQESALDWVPPPAAGSPQRSRKWRLALLGGALVLAAIGLLAALPHVLGGGGAHVSFQPGIAIVDAQTGELRASIPRSVIKEPDGVIYAGGHFWVLNLDPMSLVEVDAKSGRILKQIGLPFEEIGTYTVDGDTLWVSGPKLVKFDISLGREVDRFDLPEWTHGLALAEGSLWVTMPAVETTLRLDPATGKVQHRFADLPGSLDLAYGDGSVWMAGEGGVIRIDPDTNGVTQTKLAGEIGSVAPGAGFGWTADSTKGVVHKVDRSGQVVATYHTGEGAGSLSYSGGLLWVRNSDVGTVVGIDAVSGTRRTFRFEHPVRGAAAGSGVLLAALTPGRTYEDRINALEGKVAKLFYGSSDALETPDPAVESDFWLDFATCAKLLNYPDASPPAGWDLRPEIAASMPEVSRDGRTYTFQIRPGYRFSPPSNEEVTAETFRYSIERALSPKLEGRAPEFISDLEGEAAFRAGKADHISGLRAHGDGLTIILTEPSPNFLQRLALPFFCPVPTDSPLIRGGAGGTVFYPEPAPTVVPSAGPYYIADYLTAEYAILRRNPNYWGPRPHAFDAIALRVGVEPGQAVSRVQNGSWDGVTHIDDPLLEVGSAVDRRWGSGSRAASEGDQRYIAAPAPHTGFLNFNAGRRLFADRDVRRAAALALNRQALADVWKQTPTDQFLPPVMLGFVDRDVYRLDGPDLAQARTLMHGRTGAAVMGIARDCGPCLQEAQVVQSDLARIGIRVRIEEFENLGEAVLETGAEIDILDNGSTLDYADPAEFLRGMLLDIPGAHWLPRGVGADVRRVARLEGTERVTSAVQLADRLAVKEVPVAADGTGVVTGFFSPRLGCRVFPPFGYGVDLAALCLKQED